MGAPIHRDLGAGKRIGALAPPLEVRTDGLLKRAAFAQTAGTPVLIHTTADDLSLELTAVEKLLCFRFRPLVLRREQVERVTSGVPETSWTDLRAPGTAVPGLIRAGSYFTRRGREFWLVQFKRHTHVATIDLTGHRYRRLVLGSSDSDLAAFFTSWSQS